MNISQKLLGVVFIGEDELLFVVEEETLRRTFIDLLVNFTRPMIVNFDPSHINAINCLHCVSKKLHL